MTIKLQTLASGSSGNSILIEVNGTKILLDAGLNYKELTKRLAMCNTIPGQIHTLFTTHRHSDHLNDRCVSLLTTNHRCEWYHCEFSDQNFFPLPEGGWVKSIPADHDVECVSLLISDGTNKIALITDTGTIPCESLPFLTGLSGLVLECNHELELLINGKDPDSLKLRINETHLSNTQAHDLLQIIKWEGLQFVIGHHMSTRNNSSRLVEHSIKSAVGSGVEVVVAEQDSVSKMLVVF